MQQFVSDKEIKINNRTVGFRQPTYFIADLASNHDGDIERAKDLIFLAKEAGAEAAKFQHFVADEIVSDYGFRHLVRQSSHQSTWKKSVYEVYKDFEVKREWTEELVAACKKADIDFMTTPYDFTAIDMFAPLVSAFKIGSGDITWIEAIEKIAKCKKPVLLATGASSMEDVERAVKLILNTNSQLVLMQCNTNYTGSTDNFKFINLNVLKTYAARWPGMILGLSDHTPGYSTVLGAVTLGARVVEKHLTDDKYRVGPDHAFSMSPTDWSDMVDATRELEYALGDGVKKVEENEQETIFLQRRCIRLKVDKNEGEVLQYEDLSFLRPMCEGALEPYLVKNILQRKIKKCKKIGEPILMDDFLD